MKRFAKSAPVGRALLSLSSRSPLDARAQGRKFDRSANTPLYGSRRLARAFTAANRNYSSRKNARIRGPRLGPGPALFRERALSGIASRQPTAFLSLALKRSNRFSRLFARLLLHSATFHGVVAHVCLFIKHALVLCSIHLRGFDRRFTVYCDFKFPRLTMREEASRVVEIN